jgi:hypothetical protein
LTRLDPPLWNRSKRLYCYVVYRLGSNLAWLSQPVTEFCPTWWELSKCYGVRYRSGDRLELTYGLTLPYGARRVAVPDSAGNPLHTVSKTRHGCRGATAFLFRLFPSHAREIREIMEFCGCLCSTTSTIRIQRRFAAMRAVTYCTYSVGTYNVNLNMDNYTSRCA